MSCYIRVFPVEISEIDNIYDIISLAFSQEGLDKTMEYLFSAAADEIFSNIVNYGFEGSREDDHEKIVEVSIQIEDSVISMTFKDNGKPFDPLSSKSPDISLGLHERPIGGLGIYMVKNSFDEACYSFENGFNVFTIKKWKK